MLRPAFSTALATLVLGTILLGACQSKPEAKTKTASSADSGTPNTAGIRAEASEKGGLESDMGGAGISTGGEAARSNNAANNSIGNSGGHGGNVGGTGHGSSGSLSSSVGHGEAANGGSMGTGAGGGTSARMSNSSVGGEGGTAPGTSNSAGTPSGAGAGTSTPPKGEIGTMGEKK